MKKRIAMGAVMLAALLAFGGGCAREKTQDTVPGIPENEKSEEGQDAVSGISENEKSEEEQDTASGISENEKSEEEQDAVSGIPGNDAVQTDFLYDVRMPGTAADTASKEELASGVKTLLPQEWYAGDYGKKPVVRRQYSQSNCWAIAASSAVEASLKPEADTVFSPDHLVYRNAFTIDPDLGGSYYMAMAYMSGWQGPVSESEDPYGDRQSPQGLEPAAHVQEIQLYQDADVYQIKEAVYRYGAVQTSLYLNAAETAPDKPYYNQMTSSYYYPEKKIQNHDVVILGWDDSYSRFLFKQIPGRDGAFICQNSWGREFGEDGIFYVSYDDANIGVMAAAYSRVEPVDNYDAIYQTDDCGWQNNQGYDDEMCWFANVYTAQADEELSAVGFYATGTQAQYEVYLVHRFRRERSFDERILLQSGSLENMGYYTIDLEEPPLMQEGERFAVVVKLTTPGRKNPVAVEYAGDSETQNVVLEGKEGYLSRTGVSWQNTEENFRTNVCLKAYTSRQ